jgi:multidrug efflux pump subunit AcrB
MPYEYHAEVLGNATSRTGDDLRVLAYGLAALVGVLLLLQAAAASWRRAGLMLASLPLSLAGGVLTAPLAGGAWSAPSLAGLFAVLALAIRASILLGRRIQENESGARNAWPGDAIRAAARERAVPIVQSALVTAAVLLPAALAGTPAGLEYLHPLAVTMLGGLASVLVVQAFALPAALLVTAGRRQESAAADPGDPSSLAAMGAAAATGDDWH